MRTYNTAQAIQAVQAVRIQTADKLGLLGYIAGSAAPQTVMQPGTGPRCHCSGSNQAILQAAQAVKY